MTQEAEVPEWSAKLALSIAGEVRRHRQAQGLSAQQLSDRCARIGMPIQRSVLANMESGRRTTVTVAEVLVLAHALDVPPGVLLFPVGYQTQCEVLPGGCQEPASAVDWLSGRTFFTEGASGDFFETPLGIVRLHQDQVRKLRQAMRARKHARRVAALAADEYRQADQRRANVSTELDEAVQREIGGIESATDSDHLSARRSRLAEQKASQEQVAEAARTQYEYARERMVHAEQAVVTSEHAVSAYREQLRSRGLALPLLPRELLHLDPHSPALEDMREKPEDFTASTEGQALQDVRLSEEIEQRGESAVAPPVDPASEADVIAPVSGWSLPREAYNQVAAEEIAEALSRVLERKGMRLVHRSELDDDSDADAPQ